MISMLNNSTNRQFKNAAGVGIMSRLNAVSDVVSVMYLVDSVFVVIN